MDIAAISARRVKDREVLEIYLRDGRQVRLPQQLFDNGETLADVAVLLAAWLASPDDEASRTR